MPNTLGPRLAAYIAALPKGPVHIVTFLVDLNTSLQKSIRYVIRMEPGVQTPGRNPRAWVRLLPRFGLGFSSRSCAISASRRASSRAISFNCAPTSSLSTDRKAPRSISPICTPGLRFICPAPAGSAWIATSGMFCGEGHLPLVRDAALPLRRADFRAGRAGQCRFPFRYAGYPCRRGAPDHFAIFRCRPGQGSTRSAKKSMPISSADDVRLTMGGEPTFVSIDDFESAEWNTAAVGPTKRALADKLIRRLHTRFAPGGMLHYGQGKWYPGESLPRWDFRSIGGRTASRFGTIPASSRMWP